MSTNLLYRNAYPATSAAVADPTKQKLGGRESRAAIDVATACSSRLRIPTMKYPLSQQNLFQTSCRNSSQKKVTKSQTWRF